MRKMELAFSEPMPLILDEDGKSQIDTLREAEFQRRKLMEPVGRDDEQRALETVNAANAISYGQQRPTYLRLPRLVRVAQPDGTMPSEESVLAEFNRKAREIYKRN